MIVDESGREEAAESGSKVGCVVVQVLFHDQVRDLQKSPEWCVLSNPLWLFCSAIFALLDEICCFFSM